jgi:hypothetical protein
MAVRGPWVKEVLLQRNCMRATRPARNSAGYDWSESTIYRRTPSCWGTVQGLGRASAANCDLLARRGLFHEWHLVLLQVLDSK